MGAAITNLENDHAGNKNEFNKVEFNPVYGGVVADSISRIENLTKAYKIR